LSHEQIASALAHHRTGRLAEAEKTYRQILEREPENAEALHLAGGDPASDGARSRKLVRTGISLLKRR